MTKAIASVPAQGNGLDTCLDCGAGIREEAFGMGPGGYRCGPCWNAEVAHDPMTCDDNPCPVCADLLGEGLADVEASIAAEEAAVDALVSAEVLIDRTAAVWIQQAAVDAWRKLGNDVDLAGEAARLAARMRALELYFDGEPAAVSVAFLPSAFTPFQGALLRQIGVAITN